MEAPVALVLEDEPMILLDVETSLVDAGFLVAPAFSCAEAETYLQRNTPSIAILDVHLKDGSCHGIARILTDRGVPFILHSVLSPKERAGFEAGSHLVKPASMAEMVAAAKSLTGWRKE